jgi:Domain of unknown function (DUF4157)/L,D-transpeptidase catalytic domain
VRAGRPGTGDATRAKALPWLAPSGKLAVRAPVGSNVVVGAPGAGFSFVDVALVSGEPAAPIQRRCAKCEAEEVQVEAKLPVSLPSDPLEQEADRFAEQVMRVGAPVMFRDAAPAVQRQAEGDTEPAEDEAADVMPEELVTGMLFPKCDAPTSLTVPESSIPRGGGQPLGSDIQRFMRERVGFDFASVRIHADGDAVASAEHIAARAYTHGSDIYFGRGQFQPGSHEGLKLLAHELAHVVQQGRGGASVQRQGQRGLPRHAPATTITRIAIHQVAGGGGGEAIAYSGTTVVRRMPITSGRQGHPTPGGDYTLSDQGDAHARSNIYGTCVGAHGASRPCERKKLRHGESFVGTPMPNFRRLYSRGNPTPMGFHTGSLSTPSHGCIHLSPTDSAWVFSLPVGTRVRVDAAPSRPADRHSGRQHR